jgi:Mg2+-importing ATPase
MNFDAKTEFPPDAGENGDDEGRRGLWSRGGVILGLLLLAAVILVAGNIGEWRKFGDLVQQAQPIWLLVGLIYQVFTYICAGFVWRTVLNRCDERIPMRSLASLALAKLSIDKIIPAAGVGGGVLLVRGLSRRGAPTPLATAALLLDLLSTYAARAVAVGIAIAVLWVNEGLQPAVITLVLAYSVITFGFASAIIWMTRPGDREAPGWTAKIPGLKKVLRNINDAPAEVMRDRKLFLKAASLQFVIILLDTATLDAMLRAIGNPTRADHVFASFSMALIASTLSLIPGGLGAFEAVSVLMLRLLKIPIEAGLAATLMLRVYTLWLPMIPGFFILHREQAVPDQKDEKKQ